MIKKLLTIAFIATTVFANAQSGLNSQVIPNSLISVNANSSTAKSAGGPICTGLITTGSSLNALSINATTVGACASNTTTAGYATGSTCLGHKEIANLFPYSGFPTG